MKGSIYDMLDAIEETLADANVEASTQVSASNVTSGTWVHMNDDFNDWLECSNCGYGSEGEVPLGAGTPFCPICGDRKSEW